MLFLKPKTLHFKFATTAIGDRIYSLPIIRYLGGGILHDIPNNEKPLFEKQPYILDIQNYPHPYNPTILAHNIVKRYRLKIENIRSKETLIESEFLVHKLPVPSVDELNNKIIPWLTADKLKYNIPIVINRTRRYRDNVDWSFLCNFIGNIVFVGFKKDALPFISKYKAYWIKTKNLNELATIINSSKIFIGNQSAPLAIATGLGKTRMIEEYKLILPRHFSLHKRNKVMTAVNYYKNLGNVYPFADCTFESKNEFIMTNCQDTNSHIVYNALNLKYD